MLGKFGEMPAYALNPSNNQPYQALGGTLIPTSSVTQYAATMATWFGVDSASLPIVCPTIGNFPNAQNLGFLEPGTVSAILVR